MGEGLAKILEFYKDEPLEEVPIVPKLDFTHRVAIGMAMDCKPCSAKRLKLLGENAVLWEQRFGTDNEESARSLLLERVPCPHETDNADIAAKIAARIATQPVVTIELR